MKYIDLFIQKAEKEKKSTHNEPKHILSEIIQNHQISIVLGSPGSGKTSILRKYAQDFPTESQFVKVNSFLHERFKVNEDIKYLLFDGLDESVYE